MKIKELLKFHDITENQNFFQELLNINLNIRLATVIFFGS